MLFAGTAVASGSGIGVVTSIGMQTEIGKIQSQIAAASEEEEDTPLKQKLDEFGEMLAKVRLVCCAVLHGTARYWTVLFCPVLSCTVMG